MSPGVPTQPQPPERNGGDAPVCADRSQHADSPRVFAVKRTDRSDRRDLTFIAWVIFSFIVTIALYQSLRQSEQQRDFVYFYSIGHLLNHYSPLRLYDFVLQENIANAMLPEPLKAGAGYLGGFAYPPYVAMFFQPLAMLPYWTAFCLWLVISLTLYLTGLCLLIQRFCDEDALQRSLFFLFGLSFWPFINWILLGGQLSAIGFLGMALAIYWEDLEFPFLSGLTLSICLYKPTLLLMILPMLIVIRRPRTLAGFGVGAFTQIAVASIAFGPQIWAPYLEATLSYGAGISHVLPVTVDLRAISDAASHSSRFMQVLSVFCAGVAGAFLVGIWWKERRCAQHGPVTLTWATTITWTLLLNLYVPVYDSVLVIISIIATAAVLIRFAPRTFFGLCLVLLVSSYVSTWLSSQTGWQLLTPVLAAIGILQMSACMSIEQARHSNDARYHSSGGRTFTTGSISVLSTGPHADH
jgi:hypothetical protein